MQIAFSNRFAKSVLFAIFHGEYVNHLNQIAKGIAVQEQVKETLAALDSIKHHLWHGHVNKAMDAIQALLADCELAMEADETFGRLAKGLSKFHRYIQKNAAFMPNYGERYRNGELISTAFAESAVNEIVSKRMVKKQQMRWSKRSAHRLLQVRVKTLDNDLRGKFEAWHPSMVPLLSAPTKTRPQC